MYTADPRAHVFEGRIYVYPSHDIDAGMPENDEGDHFDMRDYHVISMDEVGGEVVDHGVALSVEDIPWAGRQLWSNDAAYKDGTYYMYFPLKDRSDVFRIGVATSRSPAGPFRRSPSRSPAASASTRACSATTTAHTTCTSADCGAGSSSAGASGTYDATVPRDPMDEGPALGPRVVRLSDDMKHFAEPVREIRIVDENGEPLGQQDRERRFFEASWMHKYRGTYYFSYSTGDTHLLVYATGDNPYGPFTYRGVILTPGRRLDDAPLNPRVQGQVVDVLPRLDALRGEDAPAEREGEGARVRIRMAPSRRWRGWIELPPKHSVRGSRVPGPAGRRTQSLVSIGAGGHGDCTKN